MLSGVMEHFGLSKSFAHAEGFETDHHRQLLKDLKISIHEGGIIALTGIVGSGKTVLLVRLQDQLRDEGQLAVSDSLTFRVERLDVDRNQRHVDVERIDITLGRSQPRARQHN